MSNREIWTVSMKGWSWKMSAGSIESLDHCLKKAASQWKRAGCSATMKHHIMRDHLAAQCSWAGNMVWSHNYADETANLKSRLRGDSVNRRYYSRSVIHGCHSVCTNCWNIIKTWQSEAPTYIIWERVSRENIRFAFDTFWAHYSSETSRIKHPPHDQNKNV